MNGIDIALLLPLIWAAYNGFRKGFIIEIATLIGLAAGIYAGLKFSNYASELLVDHVQSKLLPLISFGVTFLCVVILVFVLGKMLEKVVNLIALKLVNKVLGALFGMLKTLIIVSILLLIFDHFDKQFKFVPADLKKESLLYEPMVNTSQTLLPSLQQINLPDTGLNSEE